MANRLKKSGGLNNPTYNNITSHKNRKQNKAVTKNSSRKKYFALTTSGSSPGSGGSTICNSLLSQNTIQLNHDGNSTCLTDIFQDNPDKMVLECLDFIGPAT